MNFQGSQIVLAYVVVTCVRSFVVLRRRLTSDAERNLIRTSNRHSVYDRDRTHSRQSRNPLCEETEEARLLCRALVLSGRQRYTDTPDAMGIKPQIGGKLSDDTSDQNAGARE